MKLQDRHMSLYVCEIVRLWSSRSFFPHRGWHYWEMSRTLRKAVEVVKQRKETELNLPEEGITSLEDVPELCEYSSYITWSGLTTILSGSGITYLIGNLMEKIIVVRIRLKVSCDRLLFWQWALLDTLLCKSFHGRRQIFERGPNLTRIAAPDRNLFVFIDTMVTCYQWICVYNVNVNGGSKHNHSVGT